MRGNDSARGRRSRSREAQHRLANERNRLFQRSQWQLTGIAWLSYLGTIRTNSLSANQTYPRVAVQNTPRLQPSPTLARRGYWSPRLPRNFASFEFTPIPRNHWRMPTLDDNGVNPPPIAFVALPPSPVTRCVGHLGHRLLKRHVFKDDLALRRLGERGQSEH